MPYTMAEVAADALRARRRIGSLVYETPVLPSRGDPDHLAFKAENFQVTGSFKVRGAAAKFTALGRGRDLITASSGNHGLACAHVAAITGRKLTVVLPETASPVKRDRISSLPVEVVLFGRESGAAERHAREIAEERSLDYLSPYNDRDVIAGQGTIALELLEQEEGIDNIFIAMGGGGLAGGIASVLKTHSPGTRVFGVSAIASMALAASMEAGAVVETEHRRTLAEGVSGGIEPGSITLPLALAGIDEVLLCGEDAIAAEIRTLALTEGMLVEGAAALALAGFRQVAERIAGERSVVVLCGGNVAADDVVPLLGSSYADAIRKHTR